MYYIKSLSFLLLLFLSGCLFNRAPNTNKKVIIIGGGIAGLSAAQYLKKKNPNLIVTILEAQNQVGGRIKTDRSLGVPFDEGASWIHGPRRNPISKYIRKANLATYKTIDDEVMVFDTTGKQYNDHQLEQQEDIYNNILNQMEGDSSQSFAQIFYREYPQYQNDRLWTYMLSAFLEFDTGGDITQLSSLDFYDDEDFKGKDKLITNGFDHLVEYMAQGLNIKLNSKVIAIDYTNTLITVQTSTNEYQADYVLVTVPLGVLKKEVIDFTPDLPKSTKDAIQNLEMGSVNKFLCLWDTAFWDTDLQYIGYTPEEKGKFNYFLNFTTFSSANALMTFTFGDYSKQTETMTDQEVIEEIMTHLKCIHGEGIPYPTQFKRTKWNSSPYAFGAYSFATNGIRSTSFEVFEQSISNKIFFAGEHTSIEYRGTVHGAFLSGKREAKKILKLL